MTVASKSPNWRRATDFNYALSLTGRDRRWEILRGSHAYRTAFDLDPTECARRFDILGEAPHYETRYNALPSDFAFADDSIRGPVHGREIDPRLPVVAYRFDLSKPLASQVEDAKAFLIELQRGAKQKTDEISGKPKKRGRKPKNLAPRRSATHEVDTWLREHGAFVACVRRDAGLLSALRSEFGQQADDGHLVYQAWHALARARPELSGDQVLAQAEAALRAQIAAFNDQIGRLPDEEDLDPGPAEVRIEDLKAPSLMKILQVQQALVDEEAGNLSRSELVDALFSGNSAQATTYIGEYLPLVESWAFSSRDWPFN